MQRAPANTPMKLAGAVATSDPGARRAYEASGRTQRHRAVLRSHPDYAAPESVRKRIQEALAGP
jgi:hypothetical protein